VTGPNDSAAARRRREPADGVERITYAIVLSVATIVPLLAFAFSFGNVGLLGVSLGIDPRIAYLTGPAVDLSVTGLIVAASYLSHRGRSERELWPIHVMSLVCGSAMIALNCGQAIYVSQWRLAAFDAVGPLLLIGWGAIGPWLLRQLGNAKNRPAVPTPVRTAPAQALADRKHTTATPASTPPASAAPGALPASANPELLPAAASAPGEHTATGERPDGERHPAAATSARKRPAAIATVTEIGTSAGMSTEQQGELAAPVYQELTARDGKAPSAPKLMDELVARGLFTLKSPARSRTIRKAAEDHLGLTKDADDEPERDEAAA
jgi:hypothetical protein